MIDKRGKKIQKPFGALFANICVFVKYILHSCHFLSHILHHWLELTGLQNTKQTSSEGIFQCMTIFGGNVKNKNFFIFSKIFPVIFVLNSDVAGYGLGQKSQ